MMLKRGGLPLLFLYVLSSLFGLSAAGAQECASDITFSEAARSHFAKVWTHYRLADIVYNYSMSAEQRSSQHICSEWPNSTACHFALSDSTSETKFDWLQEYYAHGDHVTSLPPLPVGWNHTVVHLRIGDVIWAGDECWESACTREVRGPTPTLYVFPKSYYEAMLQYIPRSNSILIVANPYHIHNASLNMVSSEVWESNLQYVRSVVCFFRNHGFTVDYFGDHRSPDEDLAALLSGRSYVRGGGGFSRLASSILMKRSHKPRMIYDRVHPTLTGPVSMMRGARGKPYLLHHQSSGHSPHATL